jgi:hypothetical protein
VKKGYVFALTIAIVLSVAVYAYSRTAEIRPDFKLENTAPATAQTVDGDKAACPYKSKADCAPGEKCTDAEKAAKYGNCHKDKGEAGATSASAETKRGGCCAGGAKSKSEAKGEGASA